MNRNKQLTPNFHISEFACNDGTKVPDELYDNALELAVNLQVLRDYYGLPVRITSGFRHLEYNRRVGSNDTSQHPKAKAADIIVEGKSPTEVHKAIEQLIESGKMKNGGLGKYSKFTHYDTRENGGARW